MSYVLSTSLHHHEVYYENIEPWMYQLYMLILNIDILSINDVKSTNIQDSHKGCSVDVAIDALYSYIIIIFVDYIKKHKYTMDERNIINKNNQLTDEGILLLIHVMNRFVYDCSLPDTANIPPIVYYPSDYKTYISSVLCIGPDDIVEEPETKTIYFGLFDAELTSMLVRNSFELYKLWTTEIKYITDENDIKQKYNEHIDYYINNLPLHDQQY